MLLVFLGSSASLAQYNAPKQYSEGPGIKLSDRMVFHPGLTTEGRYDTNVFYEEERLSGAGFLRVIGHIHLATLSPQRLTDGEGHKSKQKVRFRLKTAVSFREYFTSNEAIKDQRAVEVDAGMNLGFHPGRMISISLADNFARTVTSRNAEITDTFTRDSNDFRARLGVTPGGGLLQFALGYGLSVDLFEDSRLAFANKYLHSIFFKAKWRLLPKTAITLDANQQFITYYDRFGGQDVGYHNNDSYPLRIYLGLVGLITPKLSTTLKVGYGNAFYSDFESYNMVLAQAQLVYRITRLARATVGYEHNFTDSMFANYFVDEQAYVSYNHLIFSRWLLSFRLDYRYRTYEGIPPDLNLPEFTHHLITLSADLGYKIQDWLWAGLGYDLQYKGLTAGPRNRQDFFSPNYVKNQFFGKIELSY